MGKGLGLRLSEDEVTELTNLLLETLALNDFILKKCFAESCDSSSADDFFDAVYTDALGIGVRLVTLLEPMLEKLTNIRLDKEGTRVFKYWLVIRDNYDPGDKYDEQGG